jgi:hypothetical protein
MRAPAMTAEQAFGQQSRCRLAPPLEAVAIGRGCRKDCLGASLTPTMPLIFYSSPAHWPTLPPTLESMRFRGQLIRRLRFARGGLRPPIAVHFDMNLFAPGRCGSRPHFLMLLSSSPIRNLLQSSSSKSGACPNPGRQCRPRRRSTLVAWPFSHQPVRPPLLGEAARRWPRLLPGQAQQHWPAQPAAGSH